jgi:hypothetical protein
MIFRHVRSHGGTASAASTRRWSGVRWLRWGVCFGGSGLALVGGWSASDSLGLRRRGGRALWNGDHYVWAAQWLDRGNFFA